MLLVLNERPVELIRRHIHEFLVSSEYLVDRNLRVGILWMILLIDQTRRLQQLALRGQHGINFQLLLF